MTNKKKIIFYIFMIALINISLCFGMSLFKKPEYYLRPFEGKVINAETKEPIKGAVVLAVYHKTVHTIAGSNTYEVDVQETLTDANGKFKIPPKTGLSEKYSGRPRGNINIFKPGFGFFPTHKKSKAVGENKSWPPPNKYIVYEIPKLKTVKERKDNVIFMPNYIQKIYLQAINEERKNLGLRTITIPKEEK